MQLLASPSLTATWTNRLQFDRRTSRHRIDICLMQRFAPSTDDTMTVLSGLSKGSLLSKSRTDVCVTSASQNICGAVTRLKRICTPGCASSSDQMQMDLR